MSVELGHAWTVVLRSLALCLSLYVYLPTTVSIQSRFGLAVRLISAGKQKNLGSIPFQLSFPLRKDVVCGHRLVTLSLTV